MLVVIRHMVEKKSNQFNIKYQKEPKTIGLRTRTQFFIQLVYRANFLSTLKNKNLSFDTFQFKVRTEKKFQ